MEVWPVSIRQIFVSLHSSADAAARTVSRARPRSSRSARPSCRLGTVDPLVPSTIPTSPPTRVPVTRFESIGAPDLQYTSVPIRC